MNKFTFFSIVATMWIMALFPVKVHADIVDVTVDNIVYEVDTDSRTASVKSDQSTELSGAITIASSVEANGTTYPVTSIADYSFSNCMMITSVIIPQGVTSIGNWAFNMCVSLTSVVIPEGVTSIGEWAFSFCVALTSVVIPEGVTSIGEVAFNCCYGLTSVKIPEGVTQIKSRTFDDCKALADITLPSRLASIGDNCFYDIKADATITCYSLNPPIIEGDITFNRNELKDKTLLVPNEAVKAYMATALWGEMKVLPINTVDVNGDGVVDMNDVNIVLNTILGK